jgi:ribosomal protein L18
MPDNYELEKKIECLSGRFDDFKETGIKGFQQQMAAMHDRLNRQEAYIKELLQETHKDRLNVIESVKNLEISITKMVNDTLKAVEESQKQDRDKQSNFNLFVAQKIGQIAIVTAVVWFIAKDVIGRL